MNVQEELIDFNDQIDRSHVERRVADWKARIADLYAKVASWLPPQWTAEQGGDVRFEEELMSRLGVAAEQLPVLVLQSNDEEARLEPRGLWIIGANGRIDLLRGTRHFLINDRADAFEAPDWRVADIRSRQVERRLDRALLLEMLG